MNIGDLCQQLPAILQGSRRSSLSIPNLPNRRRSSIAQVATLLLQQLPTLPTEVLRIVENSAPPTLTPSMTNIIEPSIECSDSADSGVDSESETLGVVERCVTATKMNDDAVSAISQSAFPTLSEIRNAVPAHCFERSVAKSIGYVAFDYSMVYACYLALPYVEPNAGLVGLFVWYWITGLFMAAVFVLGHDCGHGAFSRHPLLNDVFGHVCFGPIFSPYFGWQRTHRQHHRYTTMIEKDTGHPFCTESDFESRSFFARHFCKLPFSGFLRWDPLYTVLGLPDGGHFWPWSKIFKSTRDRVECVISGVVALACIGIAFHLCEYDVYTFMKYYWVPVHFQGFWLIAITYMQHHHEEVEVFEEKNWSYMRGQAETIDRVFGFGLDWILHHATDGHVAHHYFTRMSHYHLIEATTHIERVLSKYPGVYKSKPAPLSLLEFCWLNIKLDCLKRTTTGTLKYRCSKVFQNLKAQ